KLRDTPRGIRVSSTERWRLQQGVCSRQSEPEVGDSSSSGSEQSAVQEKSKQSARECRKRKKAALPDAGENRSTGGEGHRGAVPAAGQGSLQHRNSPGTFQRDLLVHVNTRSWILHQLKALFKRLDQKEITLEEARLELPKLRQQPPSSKLASTGNLAGRFCRRQRRPLGRLRGRRSRADNARLQPANCQQILPRWRRGGASASLSTSTSAATAAAFGGRRGGCSSAQSLPS
uniref:JADE2 n=1 Tax=Macrostomum lignano TaxID=282301 RepID=A0A1I8JMC9_9PLAT